MLSSEAKQRLAGDVAHWLTDGVIDAATLKTLQERYDTPGFGLLTAVKYLGISGGVLALFGLLGLVTSLSNSEVIACAVLGAASAALVWAGVTLGRDARARYTYSSRVVLALGVVGWAVAVGIGGDAAGLDDAGIALVVGAGVVPAAVWLAYREQNGLLLLLGVLALFHWVGSWSRMAGRGSYEFAIDEPRLMAPAALAVFLFGLWHERRGRPPRFHLVYQTVALIYFNLSLLMISIWPRDAQAIGIGIFSVAALGQIVLGARLKSPLVMGFGVTALALDLFTRYFERMWDRLSQGLFFVVGGLLLMLFAATVERAWRVWGSR
jgi:uncharacterized membrane protein